MSTASNADPDEPVIAMPSMTFPALRQAVATLCPARLPELFKDMQQAFTWAKEQESLTPIRVFHLKWGQVIAIERIPSRSARFHACERRMAAAGTREELKAAAIEINVILDEAQQDFKA
ncbi:hypothetical protein [Kitasatospora sp. LaBMicrA B282]|uniref:hypothetical protein n=1 Tax=Kitasatospora sp. LaBMicrA B282 TaxID=3420949 RepID=UPI003D0AA702